VSSSRSLAGQIGAAGGDEIGTSSRDMQAGSCPVAATAEVPASAGFAN
jgi:hypothetical protein